MVKEKEKQVFIQPEIVKKMREEAKFSQQYVADELGVAKNTVQYWEKEGITNKQKERVFKKLIEEKGSKIEINLGEHVIKTEAISAILLSAVSEILAKLNEGSSVTSVHSQLKQAVNELLKDKKLSI